MKLEGSQVAINKNAKKIYFVNGPEIRLIAELSPSRIMQWQPTIHKEFQDAYEVLMTKH